MTLPEKALKKSGVSGEVFVWHDILYDGPREGTEILDRNLFAGEVVILNVFWHLRDIEDKDAVRVELVSVINRAWGKPFNFQFSIQSRALSRIFPHRSYPVLKPCSKGSPYVSDSTTFSYDSSRLYMTKASTKPCLGCLNAPGNLPTISNPRFCQRRTAPSLVDTTRLNCIARKPSLFASFWE